MEDDFVKSRTDVALNPSSLSIPIHTFRRCCHSAPKSKPCSFLTWCESHVGRAVTRCRLLRSNDVEKELIVGTYNQASHLELPPQEPVEDLATSGPPSRGWPSTGETPEEGAMQRNRP